MLINYLQAQFQKRKKKNPRYSIRAFAQALKTDSSSLSKILARKRTLKFEVAEQFLKNLKVEPALRSILLLSLTETRTDYLTDEKFTTPKGEKILELMGEWEFYAILSLLELKNISHRPKVLAARLNTDEDLVVRILSAVESAGYVRKQKDRYVLTGVSLTAAPNMHGQIIRKVHRRYIEKALMALEDDSGNDTDITGMTFTMPRSRFIEAKERIKEFRRALTKYLSNHDDELDGVYRLNIQLFALDQNSKSKD